MRLELTIEPGTCDPDILAEVLADEDITEYCVPLNNMQGVLDCGAEWREAHGDLSAASSLSPGASFILTRWNDEDITRTVYTNGRNRSFRPVINWEAA